LSSLVAEAEAGNIIVVVEVLEDIEPATFP
jgi:hypothetical protein